MTEIKDNLKEENTADKAQTTDKTQAADKAQATEAAEQQQAKANSSTIGRLMQSVSEEDNDPASSLTLKTILGGDILYAEMLRKQLWLIVLVVVFATAYVAFRYQCQQDMITIDKMETELKDAKYKALASSSTLTERCRESHVLEILKNNKDSLLKASDQPPYIINVPEEE